MKIEDILGCDAADLARYRGLGAIPPADRETVTRDIRRLQVDGMSTDDAIDAVLRVYRGDRAYRTGVRRASARKEVKHASVCDALAVVSERGWTPRLPPEDYEKIAAAGFNARTLPLAFVTVDILTDMHPLGVRGLLYQLLSAGWVPSTADNVYQQVDRLTITLREREVIPYEWIVDELRVRLKPSSWSGLADFADTVRDAYRKDFWEHLPVYVEFFVEKQAMAATLQAVTDEYDVALNPIRGMSSISALHSVGTLWRQIEKPIYAYYLGDHDPSGLKIESDTREKLERYSGRSVTWQRLAVLPEDLATFDLLRLKPKTSDPNCRRFLDQGYHDCAELDAIPPDALRDRVREAITQHIPADEWARLQRTEQLERDSLDQYLAHFAEVEEDA